jgi:hypothetical protein
MSFITRRYTMSNRYDLNRLILITKSFLKTDSWERLYNHFTSKVLWKSCPQMQSQLFYRRSKTLALSFFFCISSGKVRSCLWSSTNLQLNITSPINVSCNPISWSTRSKINSKFEIRKSSWVCPDARAVNGADNIRFIRFHI